MTFKHQTSVLLTLFLLMISIMVHAQSWTQIGSDIDGEAAGVCYKGALAVRQKSYTIRNETYIINNNMASRAHFSGLVFYHCFVFFLFTKFYNVLTNS